MFGYAWSFATIWPALFEGAELIAMREKLLGAAEKRGVRLTSSVDAAKEDLVEADASRMQQVESFQVVRTARRSEKSRLFAQARFEYWRSAGNKS